MSQSQYQQWLQRCALTLSPYTFTILCKIGKQQDNANALSRFPLSDFPFSVPTPPEGIAILE